ESDLRSAHSVLQRKEMEKVRIQNELHSIKRQFESSLREREGLAQRISERNRTQTEKWKDALQQREQEISRLRKKLETNCLEIKRVQERSLQEKEVFEKEVQTLKQVLNQREQDLTSQRSMNDAARNRISEALKEIQRLKNEVSQSQFEKRSFELKMNQ